MEIIFHRLAATEYTNARRWYAQRSANLARRFSTEVKAALTRIQEAPDRWPVHTHGIRWVRTRKFPYVLYYSMAPSHVQILAVAHGRRRPGYWQRRTSRP